MKRYIITLLAIAVAIFIITSLTNTSNESTINSEPSGELCNADTTLLEGEQENVSGDIVGDDQAGGVHEDDL